MTAAVKTVQLSVGYQGQAVAAELDIAVQKGQMVCLLGHNGAGKTTLLQTIAGFIPPVRGHVEIFGERALQPLYQRVRQGMAYITDERSLIMGLSTRDNLLLRGGSVDAATAIFPELIPLLDRPAKLLSGGEQQMAAVARCLASNPKLVIADELSMGLAPQLVDRLLGRLRKATDQGLAVLLVEQHIDKALAQCDYGYVISHGKIVMQGSASTLLGQRGAIERAYIG